MKRCLILTFLLLLLTFGVANAENGWMVEDWADTPAPYYGLSNQGGALSGVTLTFDIVNDVTILGFSNGFVVSATGNVTACYEFLSAAVVPGSRFEPIYNTQGMVWNIAYYGVDTLGGDLCLDTIGVGGAYSPAPNPPYPFPGFEPGPLAPAFTVDLAIELGAGTPEEQIGEICIDSTFRFGVAGDWLFDDGTGNINPFFNNGQGEFCVPVVFVPCLPPAFTTTPAGDLLNLPHCTGGTFQFGADAVDPEQTISGYSVVDDGGLTASINGSGLFTVTGPADPGDYNVTVSVQNTCPASTEYTFTVRLTNSGLQYTNCPTGDKSTSSGKTFTLDLGLDNFDCDAITENVDVVSYDGTPHIPDASVADGIFTFNTTGDDIGIWSFEVCGTDGFMPEPVCCQFRVEVTATSAFGVRIAKIGEAPDFVFQGHYTYLPIYLDYASTEDAIGGFDFLIAYDASALTFISAEKGDAISCWEYFTYRFGPFGNCDGACPSGMLQIVAMAEANNGPYHPTGCVDADGFLTADFPAELAKIKFYVTDDRTFECQFVPVYWYWMECSNNAISDWTGNKLFVSNHVYNVNWVDGNNPYYELIPPDGTIDENDHHFGTFDLCIVPYEDKPIPIRDIDFFNGGVDIACADEIDKRGDINLNNLANEIADAVLYTNYFIYGPAVFVVNMQGQIAASDVNNDGRVLTVGDLVYLVRILTGDAVPFDKMSPFATDATVRVSGNTVSIESGVNIGGALFVFDGEADVSLLADGMEMVSGVVDGQTRALVYGNFENPASIEAGVSNVLQVNGDVTLTEVEVSDYYGNMVNADVVTKVVPKAYALLQNYPNPFNPTTEVAFDLPESANYTLDVYNIAGQLVKSFSGYSDAGTVKVAIDANGWASGIYFYRLQANNFVDTKKMVLMK